MAFSLWNLLVVLCFVILYLTVALVFVQVRRLRDDILHLAALNAAAPVADEKDDSRTCAELILRRLTSFELNMTTTLEAIPSQLKSDLDSIYGELRFLAQSNNSGNISSKQSDGQGSMRGGGSSNHGQESDAYREARLLLANGVDEERVVNETGLTVEEVSLLKRMIAQVDQGEIDT